MFELMDDELGWEDPFDPVRAFVDYAQKRYMDFGSGPEPIQPAAVSERPVTGGRLCFVITKNKASSWAEDLAEMVSVEERTRVFN